MRLDFSLISRLATTVIKHAGEHCTSLLSVSVDYTCTIVCNTALGAMLLPMPDEKRLDNQGVNNTLDMLLTATPKQREEIWSAIVWRFNPFGPFTYRDMEAL